MTDPRIKAAITEMKRLFGAGECVDRAEWSAYAECILAAADAAAWRPIATAPRNGNQVIGYEGDDFCIVKYVDNDWWGDAGYISEPTHWQPLPTPPASIDVLGGVDG